MPQQPQRYATQEELAHIDRNITDAVGCGNDAKVRIAADLNNVLRQFHSTPAVVDLRRRLLADVLRINPNSPDLGGSSGLQVTHPPEPASEPSEPVAQYAVLLYTDPDNEHDPTCAYLVEGSHAEAAAIGQRLSALRGAEFDIRVLEPVPTEVTSAETLDKIREIVATPMDAIERLDLIGRLVGAQAVAG